MAEMDLSTYGLDDLLLTAMKAEAEARDVYRRLAGRVQNAMLKDRLNFLADEEEKHRSYFETAYRKDFPEGDMALPERGVVPLPEVKLDGDVTPLPDVIEQAMAAELAAFDFYVALANRFEGDAETNHMIYYIASMEKGHYALLAAELENARRFDVFTTDWPMVHEGP
jgi:rubrerythrin